MKIQLKTIYLMFFVAIATFIVLTKGTPAIFNSHTSTPATGVETGAADVSPDSASLTAKHTQAGNDDSHHNLSDAKEVHTYAWPTVSGSPANREEMDQWAYSRGFTGSLSGKQQDYEAYSLETLETLAKGRDIHAMQTLAARLGGKAGMALFRDAAVYGSTSALQSIAIRIDSSYDLAELEGQLSNEEMRKLQLESKAYYEVAGLRGDEETRLSGESRFTAIKKIEFTKVEQQQINQRAKAIYDELQQQRTELGLGEFDNSVPDSIKKYVATLTAPKSKNSCDLPENKAECDRLLAAMKK